MIIAIDAAHGGMDLGDFHEELEEKQFNLKVATLAGIMLQTHGADVIQMRSDDTQGLFQRDKLDILEETKADAYIQIHHNRYEDGGRGVQVVKSVRDPEQSDLLAAHIILRYRALMPDHESRGITTKQNDKGQDAYQMFRSLNIPAVQVNGASLIEDREYLSSDYFLLTEAMAIAQGVLKFFGHSVTPWVMATPDLTQTEIISLRKANDALRVRLEGAKKLAREVLEQ